MPAVFPLCCRLVGQALRSVSYSDITLFVR